MKDERGARWKGERKGDKCETVEKRKGKIAEKRRGRMEGKGG